MITSMWGSGPASLLSHVIWTYSCFQPPDTSCDAFDQSVSYHFFRAEALIHFSKLAQIYLTSAGVSTFSLLVITSSNFLLPQFPVMSQPHGLSCSWFIAVDFVTTRFHPSSIGPNAQTSYLCTSAAVPATCCYSSNRRILLLCIITRAIADQTYCYRRGVGTERKGISWCRMHQRTF